MLSSVATQLLYVEDDEDLRTVIAMMLSEAGFDVTPVGSAEEALDALERARFDVVLTDYHLPNADGGWLLRSARERGLLADTPALVLTSQRQPSGVTGYPVLYKPIGRGELLAAIDDALAAHGVDAGPRSGIASTRTPALATPSQEPPAEIELVLYVSGGSQESRAAVRNLRRAVAPFDARRIALSICDVTLGGDDGWPACLDDDRVVVTPTLVKRRPLPKLWIVGSLTPLDAVTAMIESVLGRGDAAGGARRGS